MKRPVQKHYYNRRHNTRPLPDLSPGQDILFLSPMDQTSYRYNRQHIRPINTDPPSPLSRPYMHTTPQSHNNSIVWGPQNISGPPQPLSEPKVVWNMKMPSLNDTPTNPQTSCAKQPTITVPIPDPTQPNHQNTLTIPFQDHHHWLNYALISYSCTLFPEMVLHSPQQKQLWPTK